MLLSFKQVVTASMIISKIASLQVHILSRQYSHDNLFPELTPRFTFLSFVGFIVIVGAIIFCYCYFKNGFGNRNNNERAVVPSNNYVEINNARFVPGQNNQMLDYFRQQSAQKNLNQGAQMNNKVQTTNPYVTKLDSHAVELWTPIQNSNGHQKIEQNICKMCAVQLKDRQPSNVIINCPYDHCFHLSCLGIFRTRKYDLGGTGVDQCPKCSGNYSSIVKIYCPSCRKRAHHINLIDYTGRDDELDTDAVYQKFGRLCEKCS